jgi:hypothetical protein
MREVFLAFRIASRKSDAQGWIIKVVYPEFIIRAKKRAAKHKKEGNPKRGNA